MLLKSRLTTLSDTSRYVVKVSYWDIRTMLDELEIDSAEFSAQYKDSTGRTLLDELEIGASKFAASYLSAQI